MDKVFFENLERRNFMKGFFNGIWKHTLPEKEFDQEGNRRIIVNVCFGPLETLTYGITKDNQYYYKYEVLEPEIFADVFFRYIEKQEMLEAINEEIQLCKEYHAEEMRILLEKEREKIFMQLP